MTAAEKIQTLTMQIEADRLRKQVLSEMKEVFALAVRSKRKKQWYSIGSLCKKFDLSRPTVEKHISSMLQSPEFQKYILNYASIEEGARQDYLRIHIKGFVKFGQRENIQKIRPQNQNEKKPSTRQVRAAQSRRQLLRDIPKTAHQSK